MLETHPAFHHEAITPDISSSGSPAVGAQTLFDDAEMRCAQLTMDLLVAEVLRRKDIRQDDEGVILSILADTRPSAARPAQAYCRRGAGSYDRFSSDLCANFVAAQHLINDRRVMLGREPIVLMMTHAIVPDLSAHDALRLQALDAEALLPSSKQDEATRSCETMPPSF